MKKTNKDAEYLIGKIKEADKFNNGNCPQWVFTVIRRELGDSQNDDTD